MRRFCASLWTARRRVWTPLLSVWTICALEVVRKLARLHVPMAIISGSPNYAMEGIRLDVRHYIIRPAERADVRAALERLGMFGEEALR